MVQALLTACNYQKAVQSVNPHRHQAYELFYVRQGCVSLTIRQDQYRMTPGTLALISNRDEHSIHVSQDHQACYFALVHPDHVDKITTDSRLLSVFKNPATGLCHCFDLSGQAKTVLRIFGAMLREYEKPTEFSEDLLGSYVKELLIAAYRAMPQAFAPQTRRFNPAVLRVRDYIDRNFTEAFSLQKLAEEHYVSVDYLSHCFKELTGYSPQKYILHSRLQYARDLLLNTDQSIGNVAFKSGFSDVNSFIRVFKKHTGVTPNRYRVALPEGASSLPT